MEGLHVAALLLPLACSAVRCAPDAVLVEPSDERPPCEVEYSTVPKGECDLYLQDCEGSERCVAASDGTDHVTTCSPSFGGKGEGQSCINVVECDTSLSCTLGACSPVCCPSSNVPCGSEGYCLGLQAVGDYSVHRCVYGQACEPFSPQPCTDPGEICRVIPDYDAVLCVPSDGTKEEGEVCGAINDCVEAMTCWRDSSVEPGRCRYVCLPGASPATPAGEGGCPAGQQCLLIQSGSAAYGVCQA